MLYILVEYSSFKQLRRLRPESFDRAHAELVAACRSAGLRTVAERDGAYVFEAGVSARQCRLLCDCLALVSELIAETQDELNGVVVYVDDVEQLRDSDAVSVMKSAMITVPSEDEVWVHPRASERLHPYLVLEPVQGYLRCMERRHGRESVRNPRTMVLHSPDLVDRLHDALYEVWSDSIDAVGIIISGSCPVTLSFNVAATLQDLQDRTEGPEWMFSGPGSVRHEAPYTPLYGIFDSYTVGHLPSLLSRSERAVWSDVAPAVGAVLSQESRASINGLAFPDLLAALSLYMAAYARLMRNNALPAVWFCHRVDTYSERCLRVLDRVFAEVGEAEGLLPLCTCSDLDNAVLQLETKLEPLRAPKLSSNESAARLRSLDIAPDVRDLDFRSRKVLFTLSVGASVLRPSGMLDFLETVEIPKPEATRIVGELERLGLVDRGFGAMETAVGVESAFEGDPEAVPTDVGSALAAHCLTLWRKHLLPGSPALLRIAFAHGLSQNASHVMRSLILGLVWSGFTREAERVLRDRRIARHARRVAPRLLAALELWIGISKCCLGMEDADGGGLRLAQSRQERPASGDENLVLFNLFYFQGSLKQALVHAKEALIAFQSEKCEYESDADVAIGLCMLADHRPAEAADYFRQARELSVRSEHCPSLYHAAVYEAVAQFTMGNLSQCLRIVAGALGKAHTDGSHGWALYLRLIKVRVFFEAACYESCRNECLQALCESALYAPDAEGVFSAWLSRTDAYAGGPEHASKRLSELPPTGENRFFLAETLYLRRRIAEALTVMESIRPEPERHDVQMIPGFIMPWSGGFAMMEDRVFPRSESGGVLALLVRTFRGFLTICMGGSPAKDAAVDLSHISRDDIPLPHDPNRGLYHYFYACSLSLLDAGGGLERITALSRSLKFIQERAAHTDDTSLKQGYLRHNYWNKRILEEARENKLL